MRFQCYRVHKLLHRANTCIPSANCVFTVRNRCARVPGSSIQINPDEQHINALTHMQACSSGFWERNKWIETKLGFCASILHSRFFFLGPHYSATQGREWMWIYGERMMNILIIKYVARLPMFMIQKWFFHVFQTQRTGNTKKMYRSIQLHQSKCNIHTIIQWGKWFVFVVHGFNHRDRRNHSNKLSSFNQNSAINLWWWIAKKLGCTFLHQWRRPFRHFFVSSQMFLFLE